MRWYTADFDRMSWHDVHVHGFRIVETGEGVADLVFDLDYILEWLGPEADGHYRFRVAQAILQFHDVSALRLALDYEACSATPGPFLISRIARTPLRLDAGGDDAGPWRWEIEVIWPEGDLAFDSPGFSQWLVGEVVEQPAQWLRPEQRL
jgi:hypothetical protein